MGDYDQPSSQQSESDELFFSIVEAVIFECDARTRKHQFGILESQAMFN
jgi:hypothetical protein